MQTDQLQQAYQYCHDLAKQHYENFPVASRFLPKNLRQPITVIYAFARTADDFADEGELSPKQRLQLLSNYHQQLTQLEQKQNTPDNPIFIALADIIHQFKLPYKLFHDLLYAFEQDVTTDKYENFQQLQNYCCKSANPVGRLLLHLHKQSSQQNLELSDHICTALQLINFLQDMQQDAIESKRLYIPLADIDLLQLDQKQLINNMASGNPYTAKESQLIKQQIDRAESILSAGKPLIGKLSGRFKFEIALIYSSGQKIIQKLKSSAKFSDRPRLTTWDKISVLFTAIRYFLP